MHSAVAGSILLFLLFLLVGAASNAAALDIAAPLERAATAAAAGEHAAATAALEEALDAVRKEAPLVLEPFVLVERRATLFGDIEPRKSTTFSGSDELLFYMEPKNLVYGRGAGGSYEPGFAVDLAVIDAAGDVVAEKENFGSFQFASKSRLQDVFLNLTTQLTGAPPGDYTIRFTVRDLHSKKSAQAEQKVTLE